MIIRKIRSLIKKTLLLSRTIINRLKIFLLEENVSIGRNVTIGKDVTIKTTDGGKIVIGDNVFIERNSFLYAQKGAIVIRNNSYIGFGSQIVAKKSINIGEDCQIAAYTIIRDSNHAIVKSKPIFSQPHNVEEIVIKDDVWLGSHCVITAGSIIGQGAVVGANAVVTKEVESYTVVGGVPAKFIKNRVD